MAWCRRSARHRADLERWPSDMDRQVANPRLSSQQPVPSSLLDKEGLQRPQFMSNSVEPEPAGALDDNDEHVAFVVPLLSDSASSGPSEQRRVQVFTREAPERPLPWLGGEADWCF
jgi:hypothetical protein